MQQWIDFYRPHFPNNDETRSFVEECEQLAPPNNIAKIMMHQGQRLITISDDIPDIRPHKESLRLLFLLICAENIAKLYHVYQEEGESRTYVQRFFDEFLNNDDKASLGSCFVDESHIPPRGHTLRGAVDLLYDVRCDVVHEGNYWEFSFHDGETPMLNIDKNNNPVMVHITFDQLRAIIVRGCIQAIQQKLEVP